MTYERQPEDYAAVLERIMAARAKLLEGVEASRARCGDMTLRREAEEARLAERKAGG